MRTNGEHSMKLMSRCNLNLNLTDERYIKFMWVGITYKSASVLLIRCVELQVCSLLLYVNFDLAVAAVPLTNESQKVSKVLAGSLNAAAGCYLLLAHTCAGARVCVCSGESLVIYHMPRNEKKAEKKKKTQNERTNETCQVYKNTINISNSIEINKYTTAIHEGSPKRATPLRGTFITGCLPRAAIKERNERTNNQLPVSESLCFAIHFKVVVASSVR